MLFVITGVLTLADYLGDLVQNSIKLKDESFLRYCADIGIFFAGFRVLELMFPEEYLKDFFYIKKK